MIPYTYLIKHIPSGRVYYGVRYAANCNPSDLWSTYFTSSKEIEYLINRDGKESFDYQIRKTFDNANSARMWEHKVLKRMKVVKDSRFINNTDNVSFAVEYCSKGAKGKYGNKHNRFGSKNLALAEYNKRNPRSGSSNGMFGRTGDKHPNYGKRGIDSPLFGRSNDSLKTTVKCPHCSKEGKLGGMQRWHFDKCKNNKGEY